VALLPSPDLALKLVGFRLARALRVTPPLPINLTFSVTNRCQSQCATCNIWRCYRDDPARLREELTLPEIERVFRSIGPVYFFNLSGGEPFLRDDLPEIVRLAVLHLKPRVIHCPTNALAPDRIVTVTRKILTTIREISPSTLFTIKPSFDGVGPLHDQIRGVPGNFESLLLTVDGLKKLKQEHAALHVGLGTVISRRNIDHLTEIQSYALKLGVDTYISEIAEERAEMSNSADGMTPDPDEYELAVRSFGERIEETLPTLSGLSRVTQTLRTLYYDLAVRILREKRQVIPCYAAISNAHLSAHGEIWPCAVLGTPRSLGNVRAHDHDFRKIWASDGAREVRRFIRSGGCQCPLANQAYANLLLHGPSVLNAIVRSFLGSKGSSTRTLDGNPP